jgi:hypothetical protein
VQQRFLQAALMQIVFQTLHRVVYAGRSFHVVETLHDSLLMVGLKARLEGRTFCSDSREKEVSSLIFPFEMAMMMAMKGPIRFSLAFAASEEA